MTETTVRPAAGQATLSPAVRNAVLALIVGGIAAILDSTMVTIALHTLVVSLHSTDGAIGWVTTGYLLAIAVAIPVTGWAESRWGGKRVWMAALLVFVAGSALCALAWNDASLIGFRVVQGFGAGLIFPLMQTLAVRAAGGRASSSLVATISLPLALGPILGPVIGGVILNWLSWRWLFLVNVPVIAVGLALAWRFLPADRPQAGRDRPRLDLIGLGLLAPALAGILLGLSNLSQDGGVGHVGVLAPLLAGIALLAAFLGWALRPGIANPVVNVRLLRLRSLGSASAVLFTAGAALYAGMFLLPLYYQQLHGESVLDAGLLLIPQGVGSLAARFVVGRLVERFGARLVTIASFLLAAAATVPFALAGPHASLWLLGLVLLIRGFGIGAVLIPPLSVAYQDVPAAGIPHATMNTRISQQVGASFGIAIVAVALQSLLSHGAAGAFGGAFWWATGITVVALVPALALPGGRRLPAGLRPGSRLGFRPGFRPGWPAGVTAGREAGREYGGGQDLGGPRRDPGRAGADPAARGRARGGHPRRRVGAARGRGVRALHDRHRRRPRPDQQAGALPALEDPRRPAPGDRQAPGRGRPAGDPGHRHPPGRPARAAVAGQ
jgi:EmrB/QacA subfamily drug resistance transporter